jgi:ABC-2 type transport system ATP-binding protein
MEEADKLCDRIAIVDHGKLVALDTPVRLKDSVPGTEIVEAEFEGEPADWIEQLRTLDHATGATEHDGVVHITSHDGPATVAALMDTARARKVTVKRVSVQSTTLDDVFLHYTGTALRDTVQKPAREPSPFSR